MMSTEVRDSRSRSATASASSVSTVAVSVPVICPGEQQYLATERRHLPKSLVRRADERVFGVVAAFAIVDIGAFPDAVKTAIKVDAAAGAAAELVGCRDDHLQQCVDEIVAMLLAARQRARIAAQIGKMPADFVAQCHQIASLRDRDTPSPPFGSLAEGATRRIVMRRVSRDAPLRWASR
jgi:hypothetical protein